jgi:hypothetical protein
VADISVQVSSAGLTAYGAGAWGSQSFGGDQSIVVSNSSVDAFNITGWSRYTWGVLPWDQDFENISISVTSPGTPTTWGYSTFDNYSWGQITGAQIETGEESIFNEQNAEAFAITNLLTLSITSITITADANLNIFTNLLNVEEGFAQENVEANTIVEVSAPGSLPWGATTWSNGTWGEIGGMEVSQGAEEEATPSIEVFISGNALNISLTSIDQVTADANVTVNTNLLTTSLGNGEGVPNTIVSVSTNLLNVSVGVASGQVLSTVSVTGVNMTSSTGRLFITAWEVVDIGVTNNWSVVDIAA